MTAQTKIKSKERKQEYTIANGRSNDQQGVKQRTNNRKPHTPQAVTINLPRRKTKIPKMNPKKETQKSHAPPKKKKKNAWS